MEWVKWDVYGAEGGIAARKLQSCIFDVVQQEARKKPMNVPGIFKSDAVESIQGRTP